MVLTKIEDYCIKINLQFQRIDITPPPKFTTVCNMYSSPITPHKQVIIVDDSATESDTDHTSSVEWSGPENQLGLADNWWGSKADEVTEDKNSKTK